MYGPAAIAEVASLPLAPVDAMATLPMTQAELLARVLAALLQSHPGKLAVFGSRDVGPVLAELNRSEPGVEVVRPA